MGQCPDRFRYSGTARHIGSLLCHKAAHLEVRHLCLWLSFGAATTCIRQERWGERASSLETILDYVSFCFQFGWWLVRVLKPHNLPPALPNSAGCQVYTQELCVPTVPDRPATRSQSQVSISATIRFLCRQKQMNGGVGGDWRATPTNRETSWSLWEFHLSKDP